MTSVKLPRVNISQWVFLLLSPLVVCSDISADTITLHSNERIKGLVVENHEDRVVLSTVDGEVVFFRSDITQIDFDDTEYSLLDLARELEKKKKWDIALSYYERALKINPLLDKARQAALGIRSRIWSTQSRGPVDEVAKQQEIQDAWRANVDISKIAERKKVSDEQLLWKRLKVRLKQHEDWLVLDKVQVGSAVFKQGLRKQDELVSLDGKSLRYLNEETVTRRLIEPRFSSAVVQVRRRIRIPLSAKANRLRDLGFRIRQEYNGLTVTYVEPGSFADKNGLKKMDIISMINQEKTRYLPLKEGVKIIESSSGPTLDLIIRRSMTITRN